MSPRRPITLFLYALGLILAASAYAPGIFYAMAIAALTLNDLRIARR